MSWLPHGPTIVGCLWHLEKRLLGSHVGLDSESKDCAKHVRVRAGPPLSGSMVGRLEMLPDFPAPSSYCQLISLVV